MEEQTDVVVIGAGPCGLAAAIATQRAGLRTVVLERSAVVSGIASYPSYMTFFSTPEKLAIGGIPFVVATEKPSRRDALAYYRAVVTHCELDVRQGEDVESVRWGVAEGEGAGVTGDGEKAAVGKGGTDRGTKDEGAAPSARGGGPPPTTNIAPDSHSALIPSTPAVANLRVHSRRAGGAAHLTTARAVVVATGYFGEPISLGVPGEHLPHVTHRYADGHEAFQRRVVVVGGGNSAVEAALELDRCGARVTIVHFGPSFDRNIKPWVLPTIQSRVASGGILARWNSRVTAIEPEVVIIQTEQGTERVPADRVYLMIGYLPEVRLLSELGVPIDPQSGVPAHDPLTMETPVPGVFIAGVIASGYDANKTFIENGRFHGELIARRLAGGAAAQ